MTAGNDSWPRSAATHLLLFSLILHSFLPIDVFFWFHSCLSIDVSSFVWCFVFLSSIQQRHSDSREARTGSVLLGLIALKLRSQMGTFEYGGKCKWGEWGGRGRNTKRTRDVLGPKRSGTTWRRAAFRPIQDCTATR